MAQIKMDVTNLDIYPNDLAHAKCHGRKIYMGLVFGPEIMIMIL